jgi:periplasmic divalent cation tolerance protein
MTDLPDAVTLVPMSQSPNILMAYVPCPSRDVALGLARTLLDEKLIACANILDGMSSVYVWEGKVQEEQECLLLTKSTADAWNKLEKRILEIHPYEVPCVVAYRAEKASETFAQWVSKNVLAGPSQKI